MSVANRRYAVKLLPDEIKRLSDFGHQVSLNADGTVALIGSYNEEVLASATGAARIFHKEGAVWTQRALLSGYDSSNAQTNGHFGRSLDIDGDGITSVICSPRRDFNQIIQAGVCFIYTRPSALSTDWTFQTLITADADAGERFEFGTSVSISKNGDTILVGSAQADEVDSNNAFFNNHGAVYVFDRIGGLMWSQTAKILPNIAAAEARFGVYVKVSANGQQAFITSLVDGGTIFYVTRPAGTWNSLQRITVDTIGGMASNFGSSVLSLSDDEELFIMGAKGNNVAYIFEKSILGLWSQKAMLSPSNATISSRFGDAACLMSDASSQRTLAIVADTYLDVISLSSRHGAVFLFSFPTSDPSIWTEVGNIHIGEESQMDSRFGASLACSAAKTLLVGAQGAQENMELRSGAAFLYDLSGEFSSSQSFSPSASFSASSAPALPSDPSASFTPPISSSSGAIDQVSPRNSVPIDSTIVGSAGPGSRSGSEDGISSSVNDGVNGSGNFADSPPFPVTIVAAAAGGACLFLIILFLIAYISRRRRSQNRISLTEDISMSSVKPRSERSSHRVSSQSRSQTGSRGRSRQPSRSLKSMYQPGPVILEEKSHTHTYGPAPNATTTMSDSAHSYGPAPTSTTSIANQYSPGTSYNQAPSSTGQYVPGPVNQYDQVADWGAYAAAPNLASPNINQPSSMYDSVEVSKNKNNYN